MLVVIEDNFSVNLNYILDYIIMMEPESYRVIIGADAFMDMVGSQKTYDDLLVLMGKRLAGIRGASGDHNELLIKAAEWLVERRLLPTHIELAYDKGVDNRSCGYIGFFMPRTMVEHLKPDEDVKVYVTDAETDHKLWKEDCENLVEYSKKRKIVAVTVDKTCTPPYIILMALRFPMDEVRHMNAEEAQKIVDEYVWVQIRPTDFGGTIVPMYNWLMNL